MTTPVNLQGVELFPLQDKVDANKEEAGIENAEFQELMKDGQLKLQLPTDEEKDLVEEDAEETEALPFVHMPDLTHVGDTPITLKLRTASANYVTGVIENESSLKVAKEDTEKALLTPEQKTHLDVKLTTPAETLPELDNKSLNEDEAKAVSLALEEAQKTEKAPDLKSIVTTVTLGKTHASPDISSTLEKGVDITTADATDDVILAEEATEITPSRKAEQQDLSDNSSDRDQAKEEGALEVDASSKESSLKTSEATSNQTTFSSVDMQSSAVEGSKIDALTVIHENGTVNQVSKTLYTAQKSLDAGETKTLSLTLNPSELGTVNIELQKTSESQLTAKLYFEKPETLTAFQSDIQQLKDLAKELGVQENSLDLQLSLDQGNQQSSEQQNPEYTSWEDREMLFARDAGQAATKASTSSNSYGRKSCSHLDVSA